MQMARLTEIKRY